MGKSKKEKKLVKPSEIIGSPKNFEVKFKNPHTDHLADYITYSSTLGLPELGPDTHIGMSCVVVGSGPSLSDDESVLKRIFELHESGADVIACKAAIKFLHEKGLDPEYAVSMDPGDHICNPNKMYKAPGTTHIIASSSNPATFNYLLADDEYGKAKVIIFHSACGHPKEMELYSSLFKSQWCLGGGFNVVNRAISVAQHMGYEHIYLAGADSGWRDGQDFYCDKSDTHYSKLSMTDHGLVDGVPWHTAPDMLASAVAIAKIAKKFPDNFHFIGDILPASLSRHKDEFLDRCAKMV